VDSETVVNLVARTTGMVTAKSSIASSNYIVDFRFIQKVIHCPSHSSALKSFAAAYLAIAIARHKNSSIDLTF
jgi:hypothetical protein